MNAYLRNGIIAVIINVVIFIIGWGCIVPDQLLDQTHLFGIIGDIEIIRGNTAVVFGVCATVSTLSLIVGMVEAIIEDYRPRICPAQRSERPKKSQKFEAAGMRIADPSPAKEDPKISGMKISDPTPQKVVDEDKDPKTPTMD